MPEKIAANSRFSKWTVIAFCDSRNGYRYFCRCDCGKEKIVHGGELRLGRSKSCGCDGSTFDHGAARRGKKSRAYNIWVCMRNRCNNKSNSSWKNYGGRGVKCCERWSRFANFLSDMGEPPSKSLTLDRIDNSGDYEPGNCRWADRKTQRRNSRRIVPIKIGTRTVCLKEWCEETGQKYNRERSRVLRNRKKGGAPCL